MLTVSTLLPEIGMKPQVADLLRDGLGLRTVGDLLRHYPVKYHRPGRVGDSGNVGSRNGPGARRDLIGERVTIVGEIEKASLQSYQPKGGRRSAKRLSLLVAAEGATWSVTFFNAIAPSKVLTVGRTVMLSGTVGIFRDQLQLTHPNWLILPESSAGAMIDSTAIVVDGSVGSKDLTGMAKAMQAAGAQGLTVGDFQRDLVPMYRTVKGVESWDIWGWVRIALSQLEPSTEPLPDAFRQTHDLITAREALVAIHEPTDEDHLSAARRRLKYDEAVAVQLALAQRRHSARAGSAPVCGAVSDGIEHEFSGQLPFALTAGQLAVMSDICADLGSGVPMNRLLQGEVGSGKTIVALISMLRVLDNGYQCALLAPTEVLAAQHYRSIRKVLGALSMAGELGAAEHATSVRLLTGSMLTAAKRQTLLDIVSGDAGIVIGTHALLQDAVNFFNLGYVVVDEQHRFGVEQRDRLRSKGKDGTVPHYLVMTATPIPRTVALTTYGDLETSTLTELPQGRQPIKTFVVNRANRQWVARMYERMAEEIEAGRQLYVVCNRIGDGTDPDEPTPSQSVLETVADLTDNPLLAGRRIESLHGRMAAEEKPAVMDAFAAGDIDILVSTTVIEVGVDVANATVMAVHDADRFGVSQLHQLRGRVGRGGLPGLCFFLTSKSDSSTSSQRLRQIAESSDGFALAELDLRLRREGDILGSAQSGDSVALRFLSLLDDEDAIGAAHDLAAAVVADDAELIHHQSLASHARSIIGEDKLVYFDKS